MAAATLAEHPVTLNAQHTLELPHEDLKQQHGKTLLFHDKPWSSTQRVSLLTGAERDSAIAQDISQLIGNIRPF